MSKITKSFGSTDEAIQFLAGQIDDNILQIAALQNYIIILHRLSTSEAAFTKERAEILRIGRKILPNIAPDESERLLRKLEEICASGEIKDNVVPFDNPPENGDSI